MSHPQPAVLAHLQKGNVRVMGDGIRHIGQCGGIPVSWMLTPCIERYLNDNPRSWGEKLKCAQG